MSSLEELIGQLRVQIRDSEWLQQQNAQVRSQPAQSSPAAIATASVRIEEEDLLSEVDAMCSELESRQSETAATSGPPLTLEGLNYILGPPREVAAQPSSQASMSLLDQLDEMCSELADRDTLAESNAEKGPHLTVEGLRAILQEKR